MIHKYLDRGAMGVQVPLPGHGPWLRRAFIHPQQGMRGPGGGRMADFGLGSPTSEYVKDANREMLVCVQIEDVAAVENLDEILGVPDIDGFFIGPTDHAQSMGHPRATTDTRTSRRSCRTCSTGFTRRGKASGTPGAAEQARKNTEAGILYHYTRIPTFMSTYGRQFMQTVGRS